MNVTEKYIRGRGRSGPFHKIQMRRAAAAAVLLVCLLFAVPAAADTVTVSSFVELQNSITSASDRTIIITGDFSIDKELSISGLNITLMPDGENRTLSRGNENSNSFFNINKSGSKLTITGNSSTGKSLTMDGKNMPNRKSLVWVIGTFTLKDGGILTNNTATNFGDGVYVNSGTFNMEGDALVDEMNEVYLAEGRTITHQRPNNEKKIVTNGAGNLSFFGLRSSTMSGWKLVDDGTDLVLRAVTNITLNQNGGTGVSPSSVNVTYGNSTLDAKITAPTRTGYTFFGWNTLADGGVCIINKSGELVQDVVGYCVKGK